MPASTPHPALRIGTRGSALAMAQASQVRDALAAAGVEAVISVITTAGDRRAPDTAWGEGAFVGAIETALLAGEVDVAVHSAKDVPTDEDPRLTIAAFMARASPSDVVVLPLGHGARSLADLPHGARVGTDSPRRTAFLRAVRPDLALHPLHGNVDTRLRRLDAGESDALVLAEAGLSRLGRGDRISFRLDPDTVPPAPGQGAIAVQCRADDHRALDGLAVLDDRPTRLAVETERAILAASGGGCRAPLGALARATGSTVELLAGFARPDGTIAETARRSADAGDPDLVDRTLKELAARVVQASAATAAPRVLVTRATDQAPPLLLVLVDRGVTPVPVPAIEISPRPDALLDVVRRLEQFDWVVVTSANAADALHRAAVSIGGRLDALGARTRWAAVGIATTRALRTLGLNVAVRPRRASGADLATAMPLQPGARVLLPRSDQADAAMVDRLTERGATVEAVVAYVTTEAPPASRPLLADALAGDLGGVVFTSGSTVRGLLALADAVGRRTDVLRLPAVCIGGPTSAEASRLGFDVVAEAAGQGSAAVAEAVAGYFAAQEDA